MINIIDGFYLGKSTPIDSRIVASGSVARNAITYKYEGLRVYDISDGVPYVWINNAWASENLNSVSGSGTVNYITMLTSTNVIGNSVIYQSSGKIGINTTLIGYTLDVNGKIRAVDGFVGDGSSITNINVSSVTGKLPLANLTNATTNGYILVSDSPNPTYTNPLNFTVGTSINSNNVKINTVSSDSTENYLMFTKGTGGNYATVSVSNSNLKFYPSTGRLFLNSTGSATSPILAIGTANTGLYKYSTNGIGISTGGYIRALFNNDGINLIDDNLSELDNFYITNGTSTNEILSTVVGVNYDRTVYFYNIFSSSYIISGGSAKISILIGSNQIYSKLITSTYSNLYDCNYNFILPAGETLTIKCDKNIFSWNSSNGVQFFVKSFKFGFHDGGVN